MLRRAIVITLFALVPLSLFGLLMPRKPTPVEQKAIANYSLHINKVLNQFRGAEWTEKIDFELTDTMVNPDSNRPLDITELFQRTYDARTTSPRYKKLIVPMVRKMEKEKDTAEKHLQKAQIEDLLHVRVQVNCNVLVTTLHPGPEKKNAVNVPGAIAAYKDEDNRYGYGSSYLLLFGNPKAAKWDPASLYFYYYFAHPPNSPFIENVEIRIYGADDRIQQLLRKIDWKEVNLALTP